MIPQLRDILEWKDYSEEYLPLVLYHQKELYSLNFERMTFDQEFYAGVRDWYTDGISHKGCSCRLLFHKKGELIGFYLFQLEDTAVYLMQMFVSRKYRRNGFGKLLLLNYEAYGMEQGALSSFLHASAMNPGAVKFYLRNGYHTISVESDEQGKPRYFMFKSLYPPF